MFNDITSFCENYVKNNLHKYKKQPKENLK